MHLSVFPGGEQGGVSYTKGNITILGGNFRDNVATAAGEATGGVFFAATGSTITIAGGMFEGNEAKDGAVVYVFSGSSLVVEGGVFEGNMAANSGGGISVVEDGNLNVSGASGRAEFPHPSGRERSRHRWGAAAQTTFARVDSFVIFAAQIHASFPHILVSDPRQTSSV